MPRGARLGLLAVVLTFCQACGCAEPTTGTPIVVAIAGHQDVVEVAGGALVPLVIGEQEELRLCMQVPAEALEAAWQVSLEIDGRCDDDWLTPSRRLSSGDRRSDTVCFPVRLPERDSVEARHQVCGLMRDARDPEVRHPLACHTVLARAEDPRYAELTSAFAHQDVDLLHAKAKEADQAGYPLLGARIRLVAVFHLRRDNDEAFSPRVASLLGELPDWLDERPEVAALWRGMTSESFATGHLAEGDLVAAWQLAGETDRQYGLVAHAVWPAAAQLKSAVLERVGALGEARDLVTTALATCAAEMAHCGGREVAGLRRQQAWLNLIDEDASPKALREAESVFAMELEAGSKDSLIRANFAVNVALARLRTGGDFQQPLATAESLLAGDGLAQSRRMFLLGWIRLIRAEGDLRNQSQDIAARSCEALAEQTEDTQLAALAFDCAARAWQSAGHLELAARRYERALEIWRFATPRELQLDIALGTGKRAATTYRAARLAVDRGRPEQAARLLHELDAGSTMESVRRRCRAEATRANAARWVEIDREIAWLTEEARKLDRPGPGSTQAIRDARRIVISQQLVALHRELPGCQAVAPGGVAVASAGADEDTVQVRAFATDDEVIVLYRLPNGVAEARRHPLPRRSLLATVREIEAHLADRDIDDADWRSILSPIANVLIEPALAVGTESVSFALHGALQGVPLGAIPLPEGEGWLGDRIIAVLRPAAVRSGLPAAAPPDERPLVIVNPTGELNSKTPYRELVPAAEVLVEAEGTRQAVRDRMARADWLHIDTHGYYDPAFAELSYLALADGRLGLGEVRTWESDLWFANLSGCQTGRWPVTADSGRYGIGGVLAAGQVGWVVASRADLVNRTAERFNDAYYRALGKSVPAAYAAGLAATRASGVPVVEWAALMLLDGNGRRDRDEVLEP